MQAESGKIAIIIFYFGELPWYHTYFIRSCKNNPSIDFLIFSDRFTTQQASGNIQEFPFSIDDFNALASDKLSFPITVKNGMKICDFRPAFGQIFEAYLKDYNFWGYSDTDVIFGRIREFITNEILDSYDFISVKSNYPSGFFAVFRNSEKMNSLFRTSSDYRDLFGHPNNTLFEECGGYYDEICAHHINVLDSSCPVETFHHVLEKHKDSVRSLYEFFSIEGSPGGIRLTDGIMSFMDQYEVMMYHLTNFKTNFFVQKPAWERPPENYVIYRYSIQKANFIGAMMGYAYDSRSNLKFRIKSAANIALFNIRQKNYLTGYSKYRYMQDYIEFDGNKGCFFKRSHFNYSKSFLSGYLNYIYGLNLFFYFSADSGKLFLLDHKGTFICYSKC